MKWNGKERNLKEWNGKKRKRNAMQLSILI